MTKENHKQLNEYLKNQIIESIEASNHCPFKKCIEEVPYCGFNIPVDCGYQDDEIVKLEKKLSYGRITKIKEYRLCRLNGKNKQDL